MSSSNRLDDSGAVELTGKIMIVSIIVLFVVLIFVVFLHLYAKWFWYRREQDLEGGPRRRRDFAAGHQEGVTVLRRGLDVAFLKTLPVVQFDSKDFKEGLECAVCLSELEEGEKTRILPKCNHGFHLECIDMWFHSHSTCPICRNTVSEHAEISLEHLLENHQAQQEESPESILNGDSLPTNILFWGDETEVSTLTSQLEEANHHHHQAPALPSEPPSSSSSSTSQTNNNRQRPDLVIDIPRQINEDEDQKTPASSRMRSLRRILSSGRRFNIFSPGSVNVEQVTATGSQS